MVSTGAEFDCAGLDWGGLGLDWVGLGGSGSECVGVHWTVVGVCGSGLEWGRVIAATPEKRRIRLWGLSSNCAIVLKPLCMA